MTTEELSRVLHKTKRETKMQKVFLCVACCIAICAVVSLFVDDFKWSLVWISSLLSCGFECSWYWQLADMNTDIAYRQPKKGISKLDMIGLIFFAFICGLAEIFGLPTIFAVMALKTESIVLWIVCGTILLPRFVFMFRVATKINAKWKIPYGIPNLPYSPSKVLKYYAIGQLILFGVIVMLMMMADKIEDATASNIYIVLNVCINVVFYIAISYISIPRLRAGLLGINYPAKGSSNEAENTDNENDFDEE